MTESSVHPSPVTRHQSLVTHHLLALFAVIVVVAALHVPAALAAVSHEAEGGCITSISFTVASRTDHWQGYYGALSYTPPKSADYPDYFNTSASNLSSIRLVVLNITAFTPYEYLLITSSSSINLTSLQAGDVFRVDSITGTGSDSGTNTFTGDSTFYNIPSRGKIQNVPTAHISGNFCEGLLKDEDSNNAFIVPIGDAKVCFDGSPCNFEFILPTNRSNPVTYYMYYLSSEVTTQLVTGQITYSNNNTGIPGVSVNLTAATNMTVLSSTTTNETGYYNFTNLALGEYYINASKLRFWDNSTGIEVTADEPVIANLKLWLVGDLNNDGKAAQADDLTLMIKVVLWEIAGDWRYDLNRNGIIGDAGNLVLMNRAVLREIILMLATVISVSAQPTADSFGVQNTSGTQGTSVIVPVNITNTSNGTILGIVFNIAYDKNVINVTNVLRGELTSDWNVLDFNNDFEWGSRVAITGASNCTIPNGTSNTVALLNFAVGVTSDSKGYSYMTMSGIQLSGPNGSLGTAPARNGLFQVTGLPTPPPHARAGGTGWYPSPTAPALAPSVTAPVSTPAITATPKLPALRPTISPPLPVAQKQTWTHICLIGIGLALIIIGVVVYYFYIRKKA